MTETLNLKGVFKAGGISIILAAIILILFPVVDFLAPSPPPEHTLEDDLLLMSRPDARPFFIAFGTMIMLANFFEFLAAPALYLALRNVHHTYSVLGSVILAAKGLIHLVSTGVASLMMLSLSGSHVASSGEARTAILATAEAVAAARNGFDIVAAGFLIGVATIIISLAMLKGVFPRWIGWIGILTGTIAVVLPFAGLYPSPLLFPIFVIRTPLFIIWFISVGIKLYRL